MSMLYIEANFTVLIQELDITIKYIFYFFNLIYKCIFTFLTQHNYAQC